MLLLPWSMAQAAPEDEFAEEIIVYGDEFARWDDTRWLVQSELLLPLGIVFAADENVSFRSPALQVRAVIACDKDGKLSRRKWEVSCAIEDIGILAASEREWKREKDREKVQLVLDQLDAKLTGAQVQMQVVEDGGITNFDIEGLDTSNERERLIQESLRQVVNRVMAGFHLRIPDHAQRGGQFVEYNNELMDLPSDTGARGSTTMVHLVTPDRPKAGLQLVQTVGEGTISSVLPSFVVENPFHEFDDTSGSATSGGGGSLGSGAAAPTVEAPTDARQTVEAVEVTYTMKATGVALFEKATGIMTERVWACTGRATAGSAGGVDTGPYRNVGRIQMLGTGDKPDVGPTRQVAWPGRQMVGLDPWVDIETMPSDAG